MKIEKVKMLKIFGFLEKFDLFMKQTKGFANKIAAQAVINL